MKDSGNELKRSISSYIAYKAKPLAQQYKLKTQDPIQDKIAQQRYRLPSEKW